MNRRQFVRGTLAAAAGTISLQAFPHHLFAADKPKETSDVVALGPMGVRASRLALGTGTNGTNHHSEQTRSLGNGGVAALFKLAYDNGVTFWDSADQYGSHPALREALKTVPRDKVTILTKTEATTEQEMRADLDRFRREIGTDYIDILLLHCLSNPDWPRERQGAMNVLSEAREKGIVRTHGVSCHTLGALQTAAKTDWVQVDLARVNPAGAVMDADPATVLGVLRQMKAAGKGVIGMKILGAGELAGRADECFQWALAQECVDCFTLGIQNAGEFQRTIKQVPAASVRA
jgi:aryl-alcohol dehydrogenase-like predicted oxidoreductase